MDERTENEVDEAESHPAKASKASRVLEVDLEQGGSGGTWSPKATQGGPRAKLKSR
jgi:hypothetical protein